MNIDTVMMKTRSSDGYSAACYGKRVLDKSTSSLKVSIFVQKYSISVKNKACICGPAPPEPLSNAGNLESRLEHSVAGARSMAMCALACAFLDGLHHDCSYWLWKPNAFYQMLVKPMFPLSLVGTRSTLASPPSLYDAKTFPSPQATLAPSISISTHVLGPRVLRSPGPDR